MLTLIRREIEDHRFLYVLMFILGVSWAAFCGYAYHEAIYSGPDGHWPPAQIPTRVIRAYIPLLLTLTLISFVFQQIQKHYDDREKISLFLCTLTATRGKLLLARWLAALMWLVCGLLPIWAVHTFHLFRAARWNAVRHTDLLWSQLGLMVFLPIGCYLLSQFMGQGRRITTSLCIDAVTAAFVISLVAVKGVFPSATVQICLILGLLSIAAGVGTWSRTDTLSL